MFFDKPFSEDEGEGYGRFANFEGGDYEFIVLEVLRDGSTKVSSKTIALKINSHAPEFFSNGVKVRHLITVRHSSAFSMSALPLRP